MSSITRRSASASCSNQRPRGRAPGTISPHSHRAAPASMVRPQRRQVLMRLNHNSGRAEMRPVAPCRVLSCTISVRRARAWFPLGRVLTFWVASLAHVAVGLLAGRIHGGVSPRQQGLVMAAGAGLALSPDLDVMGGAFGFPDFGPLGHRGFTHSLVFALALSATGAWLGQKWRLRPWHTALFVLVAVGSHGF